jgi:hypothetical protein
MVCRSKSYTQETLPGIDTVINYSNALVALIREKWLLTEAVILNIYTLDRNALKRAIHSVIIYIHFDPYRYGPAGQLPSTHDVVEAPISAINLTQPLRASLCMNKKPPL